jgi:hypothetical protein
MLITITAKKNATLGGISMEFGPLYLNLNFTVL